MSYPTQDHATEPALEGFTLPTFAFEPPADAADRAFIASVLTWCMEHDDQTGVFGQQPYTNPPAYSGIRIHRLSYDATVLAHVEHDRPVTDMKNYTGWWIYFTYHDSMTSPFHSPLFKTDTVGSKYTNYYTWEY